MEEALKLINKEDGIDESKPYEFKYQGRAVLKTLLNQLQGMNEGQDSVAKQAAKALALKYMGSACMDCEEMSDA
jgi:hypothetical protein